MFIYMEVCAGVCGMYSDGLKSRISSSYRAHYANIHSKCRLIGYLDRAPRSVKAFSRFARDPAMHARTVYSSRSLRCCCRVIRRSLRICTLTICTYMYMYSYKYIKVYYLSVFVNVNGSCCEFSAPKFIMWLN